MPAEASAPRARRPCRDEGMPRQSPSIRPARRWVTVNIAPRIMDVAPQLAPLLGRPATRITAVVHVRTTRRLGHEGRRLTHLAINRTRVGTQPAAAPLRPVGKRSGTPQLPCQHACCHEAHTTKQLFMHRHLAFHVPYPNPATEVRTFGPRWI